MIIATIFCALSFDIPIGIHMIFMFTFFRLILGIGIGGDYPLSAIIASEFANVSHRGLIMAAVFSMQGLGILISPIIALFLLSCFSEDIEKSYLKIDYVWRLCLLFGVIPAAFALYFRLRIPESPRYTASVRGNVEKAKADIGELFESNKPLLQTFPEETNFNEKNNTQGFFVFFKKWKNLRVLLGCSISWFALDVAFYGSNLNQSVVLEEIGFSPVESNPYNELKRLILGNLVIVFFGTCTIFF